MKLSNDVRLENARLREMAMNYLTQGGAPIEYICDIIKKMYMVDKEDFTDEDIENQVYTWREVNLEDKNKGGKSIRQRVEDWLHSYTSNKACNLNVTCSLLVCYLDLGIKNPNDKTAVRVAFKRLVEQGKLEPMRNRSGMYRILNGQMEDIDFMSADTTPFPIKYPLGVHELIETYKKSLVVLAGEPNAGKTAFLLNLAWKNKDRNPWYFSSEGGAAELRIRLNKFNHPLEQWKDIRFISKTSDYKDVIDPNGLNIIDYLEVSKDFYEIGGLLTDIYNVLKDGVAVVGIQKPSGRDTGVGGARTLDKARLYMAIEPGMLKIVKGKLWRQDCVNPNGMFVKWQLGGGANFKVLPDPATGDDWRRSG